MAPCKNPDCIKSEVVYGAQQRAYCKTCSTSFINDGFALELVPRSKLSRRKYPECFYNWNSEETICTTLCNAKRACKRTIVGEEIYHSHEDEAAPAAGPVECPHCGHTDSGKYCSQCGSPLSVAESRTHFPIQIVQNLLTDWPPYFRTVFRSIWSPRQFFAGAFAKNAALYFDRTGTLSPKKFFLMNTSAIAIVTITCNYFLGVGIDRELPLLYDALDVVTVLAFQYIPCLVILFFLNTNMTWIRTARKKSIIPMGEPKLDDVFKAMAYASSVQLLSTPLMIAVFDAEDFDYFIPFAVLGLAAKLISELVLLPFGIAGAAHVPRSAARAAVSQTYGVQLVLLNGIRLLTMAS